MAIYYAVADWIIGNHVIQAAHIGGYFCATAYIPPSDGVSYTRRKACTQKTNYRFYSMVFCYGNWLNNGH